MSKRGSGQRESSGGPSLSQRIDQYLTIERMIIGGSIVATLVIVAAFIIGGSTGGAEPPPIIDANIPDNSVSFAQLQPQHIPQGSPRPNYNSNPPTSGPHYANLASCRVYNEGNSPIDERIVHSLEHGSIWISYRDAEDSDTISQIENLAGRFSSHILVSHRPENDAPIAMAAWTRLLELDEFNEAEMINFINRYRAPRGFSPEPGAPC